MNTYFMFGKFSSGGLKEISAERTKNTNAIIEKNGGKAKALYVLLGEIDAVAIVDFPGLKEAMKTSVELSKLLGASFVTAPAMAVEEFDKFMA